MFVLHHFFIYTNSTPNISAWTLTGAEEYLSQVPNRSLRDFAQHLPLPCFSHTWLLRTSYYWKRFLIHSLDTYFMSLVLTLTGFPASACVCMLILRAEAAWLQSPESSVPLEQVTGEIKRQALIYEEETWWQSNSMTCGILYQKLSATLKSDLQNIHSLVSTQIAL